MSLVSLRILKRIVPAQGRSASPGRSVTSIPAIVHADGANGARFRSDLFLFGRQMSLDLKVIPELIQDGVHHVVPDVADFPDGPAGSGPQGRLQKLLQHGLQPGRQGIVWGGDEAPVIDRPEATDYYEFFALGVGDPIPVSAVSGKQSGDLLDRLVERIQDAGAVAVITANFVADVLYSYLDPRVKSV